MALGTAKTIIEQAGLPLGSPGVPRRDIATGVPVVIRNASDSNVYQHRWRFIAKPNNSTAFIADPIAPTCVFTPDVVGTWIVELQVNEGVPPNQVYRTIVAVEDPLTGWRFPSFNEQGESNGWVSPNTGSPNYQGWADDLLHVLSDILNFVQPTLQSYVTVNNDTAALPNSRRLVQASDVVIADGGAGNPITFSTAYLIGTRRALDQVGKPENIRAVRTLEAPTCDTSLYGQTNFGSETGVLYGTKAAYSTIGGGRDNLTTGTYATIAGGHLNTGSGTAPAVGGGEGNSAAVYGAVAGGSGNSASGDYAAVAGGSMNGASGQYAAIGGGSGNSALETYTSVSGGQGNACDGTASHIGGGQGNATGSNANVIGGGISNTTAGNYSGVFCGEANQTFAESAGVLAGVGNSGNGSYGAVVCGETNTVLGQSAAVLCGQNNSAEGAGSATLAGTQHIASGASSVCLAGNGCLSSGSSSIASGTASAATASGAVAIGNQCFATHSGSLVLGDNQANGKSSATTDQATISYINGIRLLGEASVEVRQHSGFTGAGLFTRTGAARTTNNSTNSIILYSAVEDRIINCRGVILAKQDGLSNGRSFAFNRSFLRQAGVVQSFTAHQSDAQTIGVAAWTTAITTSGTDIVLQYAGAAATTIDWAWSVMFQVGGEGS